MRARGGEEAPGFFSSDVARARRFYLDLKPAIHRKLTLVCGGLEHCTADYAIRRTEFPFFAIEYVARGAGKVKFRRKSFSLKPGTVFSYGPGVPHEITGDRDFPLVKYFVDFSGKNAPGLLKSCNLPAGEVAQVFPPNALALLFDELLLTGATSGRQNPDLCSRLLECLTLKIASANVPIECLGTLAFATYQQSRRHIERNFLNLHTLEQVASQCHMDKAYLCRLFQRYDHQSPYQFLLRLKMNDAAERLQQPGALVKQVAEKMGFSDPFHFSRVFRKVLGVSPAAFRNFC